MGNDPVLFGPETEPHVRQARELRARHVREWAFAARRSPRFRRGAAAIGASTVAFIALASFAPGRQETGPSLASISPSELTAAVRNLPTAGLIDAH
jgi:hypothetical protein